jgi:hypothetical protein
MQQDLLRASEVRELELKHKLELTESEARFSEIITLVTCRENRENDYFVVHGVLVQ